MKYQAIAIVSRDLKLTRLERDTREEAQSDAECFMETFAHGTGKQAFKAIVVLAGSVPVDVWACTAEGISRVVRDGELA